MYESDHYIAIPPGATIREQLEQRGMPQKEFAQRMGYSEKHISNLINGKVELTTEVALRLETVLGLPMKFWQSLEAQFRESLARVNEELEMDKEKELAKKFPYSKMVNEGWVPKTRKAVEKVENLRRFFEVAKLGLIETLQIPGIAYRVNGESDSRDYALAVWAQKARLVARDVEVADINIEKLKKNIPQIRNLTTQSPEVFCKALKRLLGECGVVIVFLPHLGGSFLHGASFVDNKHIVLGLTVRGKSADIFWFSLFHELFHIIEGHIFEGNMTTTEQEKAADKYSAETLIPQIKLEKFLESFNNTKNEICEFANEIGIAPGIVLGRLQKENILGYQLYQDLKVKYKIA